MKNEHITAGVLSLMVAGTLFTTGCSKEESTSYSTPGGDVTVTTQQQDGKDTVTVKSAEGSLTVSNAPQKITEAQLGVPLYPGAQLVSSAQLEQNHDTAPGMSASYLLTSSDGFDQVAAFYKANLKDIHQTMDQGMGDQKIALFLVGKKNAHKSVQIMSDAVEGKTAIQVTWLPEE